MKFIPLLYQTPMVQAVIEDRKTMTRRLKGLKFINESFCNWEYLGTHEIGMAGLEGIRHQMRNEHGAINSIKCPYGQVGDVLWVRETWEEYQGGFNYKAGDYGLLGEKWRPSIFMPKDACRIFLEVTGVKIERLQDISAEDAIKEGIACVTKDGGRKYKFGIPDSDGYPGSGEVGWKWQDWQLAPQQAFQTLWSKINGEESWRSNPFVWAISFKRIEKPSNFQ